MYLHTIWIAIKALPHCRRHGIRLQWSVWQVIIMEVNATTRLWQRRNSPMMEVWNHILLQVCEVRCKCYSYLELNIFIVDVDYDFFMWIVIIFDTNYYLWCGLWLFLTWFMMIFVVIHVYAMYSLYLNYSGTDTKKRKITVWSRKKLKRIKVRLSGAICFEKNMISKDSLFVPSNEEKYEGGVSICNEYRTSDEE